MKDKRAIHGLVRGLVLPTGTLFFAILLFSDSGFAKMYEKPRSFSLEENSQDQVQRIDLPAIDTATLLAEDRVREKNPDRPRPQRFAIAAEVTFALDTAGTWRNVPEGQLWRLRIRTPGATSLNLGITRFDMPEGAKLWIYDPEHTHIEGPYTSRHRSHRGSLWTPVIQGEEIVVEVFVPAGIARPVIEIKKVNQGYRGFELSISGCGTEGLCENDVVCPVGNPWRDQIRAVGLYTLNGVGRCSGTLLNNTSVDLKPYFLSANHCLVNSSNDDTVVVYWNYQSAQCGTHGPGSTDDNQSGSIFRAGDDGSDFLLLELSQMPDPASKVFYAGWDASGATPPSTVGIHHPKCDVKAISFSNSPPEMTIYDGNSPPESYWRVLWDSGIVEDGSSGSCLFAKDTGRCIGHLRGGNQSCTGMVLENWYGRLNASWTGGGTPATRLSDWLDPGSTGISSMNGEPHITTVNGVHYDFQGAGEFVALRDAGRLEIQTRHAPIATTSIPGPDPHDGLATCVSFTTAIAVRVGKRRVTYIPNISAVRDPSGLQLRVDGVPIELGPKAIDLGDGGRIVKTLAPGGLEIDFLDGSILFVTPGRKDAQSYLNLDLIRAPGMDGIMDAERDSGRISGAQGIMGTVATGNWLPALPNGRSMGPMPASLHERYLDLYQKFADAWRVTDKVSLFDYAQGESTDTFTMRNWPPEKPPCIIPEAIPVEPASQAVAQNACGPVTAKKLHADCVFDVMATGDTGFAKTYLLSQRIREGSTTIRLGGKKNSTKLDEITFTATVVRATWMDGGVPTGSVQFTLDGNKAGGAIELDTNGRATWVATGLKEGKHVASATYNPAKGSTFLVSTSFDLILTVDKERD